MKSEVLKRVFGTLVGVVLTTLSASAANTDTWVGNTDASWGTSGNWTFSSGFGPVASGDSLVFGAAGSSGLALNNNLSGLTLGKITFNSGASSFNVGGNAFTLGGGIDASALSSGTETISVALTPAAGVQRWNVGTGATLALGSLPTQYGPAGAMVVISKTGTKTTTAADGWSWRSGAVANTGLLGPGFVIDNGDNTYDWASAGNSGGPIVAATYTTAVNTDAHNVKVTSNTTVSPNASWASLLVGSSTLTANAGGSLYLDTGIILENGGTLAGSAPIKANNDGLYIYVPDSGTISSSIQNNGSTAKLLYKAGPGTLTLSGANAYTGNTVVYEGALIQSTAAIGAGGYLVKDHATLGVSVVSGGTLKMSSLSFGNSTNAFTGVVTNSAAITNTGALTLAGTVTVNVSASVISAGQYPLIASASIGGTGGFVVGSLPAGIVGAIVTNGNTIVLNVTTSQPPPIVWSGGGTDNNWTTGANWTNGVAPGTYDSVLFAGTTQLVNNMNANFLLGSLTFGNTAGNFNVTNAANTLTLNGGLTNNSANTQTINVPVTMSTTQSITAAAGNLIFGQNINNNGNTVTFTGSGNVTLNGMLTGSGGVVKSGAGTTTIRLPFTPPASYSGNTVIQAGTLQLLNDSFRLVTSTFSGAGNLTVANGGGVVGPMLLWGANNLTGTTTVSNGSLFVAYAPNQSLGSTIRILDGATFGVLARADTNYLSPANLVIGSSLGATLQFGMQGISEPGLTGTNHAPIQAGTVTINGTATINIANCPFATNSYPLFTGYSSGNLVLGSQPLGYSGKLTVSGSTVYYTVTNLDNNYRPFVHPGCMSTQADIDRMKAKIAAGAEPWASGYAMLTNNSHSWATYTANPIPYPSRGVNDNYNSIMNDAAAAYECALRWKITGDTNYAEAARRNMDGYATTTVQLQGNSNVLLMMGAQGFDFACAAELLRDYQPWVNSGGFARFQNFLVYRFYTDAINGNGIWWFLNAHNGTCWSHYWLNWDGFALSAAAAIGVVCDRRDVYNFAVNYYKGSGAGNGMVTNALYFLHPGYLGQSQEMGRDMGHASLDPVLLAQLCEVAWNQGDDLFGYDNNALLAISEMTSRAMTADGTPWVNYAGCDVNTTTIAVGSLYRAGLDMIWNHYVNIKGLSAPYTMASALASRPEGGGGNYGGNSGGFDQLGFTTLTHALDATTNTPAPSSLQADAPLAGTARVWWYGSAYATGYNVKRATSIGGPYTVVASNVSPNNLLYTDTGLTPDTTYYYVVSAIINGGETTNSLPVSVTANQRLTGTVIGTDSVFINGQWKYQLFDNAPITWFDASSPSGAWAGLDLGSSYRITKVGYYPRIGYASRMTGGRFQGCNVADFSSGVVTLYTIGSTPPEGTNTAQFVTNTNGYRYVRYIGPANGYCNAAEIQFEGYPAPAAAPAWPALQAYLKFDESSGTSAADATGNGWNGTLINSATHVAGYSNNAVNLSGSSQYVTLPSGVVANLDAVSITAWVKLTSSSTWSRIFDFGTGQTVYMFLTPQNGANNFIRFAITTSGGAGEQVIDGIAALPTGVWTHVAVTIGGNGGVLYVNGMAVGTNSAMTLAPSFLGATTQNYIGKSQYNDPYLNGLVDDFRIYNGALSAGDVATFVTPLVPPANVNASAGDGQAALTWDAATNASSYNVLRSLTNGGPYTLITNVPATTFTDTALTNGVMYYYVIHAANAVGESPNSAEVGARPVSTAPLTSSVALVGKQLQLSWPTDHTGWRLLMNTNLSGTNWMDVPGANATNALAIPTTNGSVFYRLVYP